MKLRPYQEDILNEVRAHMSRGTRRILIRSVTGSGKTATASEMLRLASEKGINSWFTVHRRELVKQSCNALREFNVPFGITANGFPHDYHMPVQLCSIGSIKSRLKYLRPPKLIVVDEGHHACSKSWSNLLKMFPEAYIVLLTATPERLDGKGLKDFADVIVNGPEMRWLIDNKYLADYDYYNPNKISMAGVKKEMGDYSKAHSVALVDKPAITGSAVAEYKKIGYGKRCLGFAITIEHSHHIIDQYKAAGIPAAHLDGDTPSSMRDQILADLKTGELKYVCNVGLFGEGFDCPSLDGIQMLRPSASLSWFLQACGRPLRFDGDKTAFILDHVGNIDRHGLPCQERQWSLDGRVGRVKRGDKITPIKICDKCFGAQPSGAVACRYCGGIFEVKSREIEEVDGELTKVDKEKLKLMNKRERGSAQTFEELVALGTKRGYKNPMAWASHIHKAREAKNAGFTKKD